MTIDQAAAQPASLVCHVGNRDRFVCHCLSDCRPPGEWTCMFVFSFVCYCSRVCVWCTLLSLGYPLQPVQETNKLHFNLRNINFPLDGKLIMAVEPSHLTLSMIHSVTAMKSTQPQWQHLINTSAYKDDRGKDLAYLSHVSSLFVDLLCRITTNIHLYFMSKLISNTRPVRDRMLLEKCWGKIAAVACLSLFFF